MSEHYQGPKLDRWLIRTKDMVLALAAMGTLFYAAGKLVKLAEEIHQVTGQMNEVINRLDFQQKLMEKMMERISERQNPPGYHPKKGGWLMKNGRWYFIEDDEIQRAEDK